MAPYEESCEQDQDLEAVQEEFLTAWIERGWILIALDDDCIRVRCAALDRATADLIVAFCDEWNDATQWNSRPLRVAATDGSHATVLVESARVLQHVASPACRRRDKITLEWVQLQDARTGCWAS